MLKFTTKQEYNKAKSLETDTSNVYFMKLLLLQKTFNFYCSNNHEFFRLLSVWIYFIQWRGTYEQQNVNFGQFWSTKLWIFSYIQPNFRNIPDLFFVKCSHNVISVHLPQKTDFLKREHLLRFLVIPVFIKSQNLKMLCNVSLHMSEYMIITMIT